MIVAAGTFRIPEDKAYAFLDALGAIGAHDRGLKFIEGGGATAL